MLAPYASVVIRLLQGVVYNDERDRDIWNSLIKYRADIEEYFEKIGIILRVDESEGFAFLKQRKFEPEENVNIPNLIGRHQLSYPVTLLCVLLAEKLTEFESKGENTMLVLDAEEIKEMLRIFLPEKSNEVKLLESIDTHIRKLVDYGFLRELSDIENKYEVKRLLKAMIPAGSLHEIKDRLELYAKQYTE